jgi:transcriptional regulator with XRE-family HTH domain
MARIALAWTVKDLGKHAGIGSNTVVRFENGHRVIPATLAAMQRALEAAGVRFQEDGGIVPPAKGDQNA